MLQDENTATRFLAELNNQLEENLSETENNVEKWIKLVDAISAAGENILGYKDGERKE